MRATEMDNDIRFKTITLRSRVFTDGYSFQICVMCKTLSDNKTMFIFNYDVSINKSFDEAEKEAHTKAYEAFVDHLRAILI